MSEPPNLEGDFSYTTRVVILKDWWVIKCSEESNGKRFGVAGHEISTFVNTKAVRGAFRSSPIIIAFDAFNLESSDGLAIILRGFLNKERVVESGFTLEISRHFIFGFPPCWETICNNCFKGVSSSSSTTDVEASHLMVKPNLASNNRSSSRDHRVEKRKGQLGLTKSTHGSALSKGMMNCSKRVKIEESNKKTLESVGKSEKSSSRGKKKNQLSVFDFQQTLKKQTETVTSTDSLETKRSRSGRLLLSPLEFWRNEIPIYDKDRNLSHVKKGDESDLTLCKGKENQRQEVIIMKLFFITIFFFLNYLH